MTDPVKTDVFAVENAARSAVASAEETATVAALAQVNKQESWIKTNWKALVIGFVVGLLVGHFM